LAEQPVEQGDQHPGGDDRAQHAEQLGAADPLDLAAQPDRLHRPEQGQQRPHQELDRGAEVEAAGHVAVLLGGGDHAGVVEPGELVQVGLEGVAAAERQHRHQHQGAGHGQGEQHLLDREVAAGSGGQQHPGRQQHGGADRCCAQKELGP